MCVTVELDIMFSKDIAKWKKTNDKKERAKDRILWNTRREEIWHLNQEG